MITAATMFFLIAGRRRVAPNGGESWYVVNSTNPTACNGIYITAGTFNSKPYYKHATEDEWIWWDGSTTWWIGWERGGGMASKDYYRTNASELGIYAPENGEGTPTVNFL